jgi:CubicO group peptidase (beta-lactamase class C family)
MTTLKPLVRVGLAAVVAVAGLTGCTTDTLTGRALLWGDSDLGDIDRFPSRRICAGEDPWRFRETSAETRACYAPVFADLDRFVRSTGTVAFLVIKDDEIIAEAYAPGYGRESMVTCFSVTKSFVSALTGCLLADGYIESPDDPITLYLPELLDTDPLYQGITLRHLLTMSSGIRYREGLLLWGDDTATYYHPDLRQTALSSPVAGPPGTTFRYNNYHPLILGLLIERVTGRSVSQYLSEKIWIPLGMEGDGSWSLDSEASGFEKMESGLNARAVDLAKFGRLYLYDGVWEGERILPEGWVRESTAADTQTDPAAEYQYLWWVRPEPEYRGHFYAAGKHGQYIYLIPEQNLIFVRLGRREFPRGLIDRFEAMAEEISGL